MRRPSPTKTLTSPKTWYVRSARSCLRSAFWSLNAPAKFATNVRERLYWIPKTTPVRFANLRIIRRRSWSRPGRSATRSTPGKMPITEVSLPRPPANPGHPSLCPTSCCLTWTRLIPLLTAYCPSPPNNPPPKSLNKLLLPRTSSRQQQHQ